MIKLYTIRNNDGKFYHSGMGGRILWCAIPDYQNAARDRDQACGWRYNLSKFVSLGPLEVVELTLSW